MLYNNFIDKHDLHLNKMHASGKKDLTTPPPKQTKKSQAKKRIKHSNININFKFFPCFFVNTVFLFSVFCFSFCIFWAVLFFFFHLFFSSSPRLFLFSFFLFLSSLFYLLLPFFPDCFLLFFSLLSFFGVFFAFLFLFVLLFVRFFVEINHVGFSELAQFWLRSIVWI